MMQTTYISPSSSLSFYLFPIPFIQSSLNPCFPPLLLTLQIHWNKLINNIQRIRLIFSSSNEPCLFQLVPPQSYKQPLSHGVLEAYNSLDKAQNRKLNRQDNRSWISFAVQKSQVSFSLLLLFFFTDFYERFNFLSLRHLSKIDPLRHARPLTAVLF